MTIIGEAIFLGVFTAFFVIYVKLVVFGYYMLFVKNKNDR